MKKYVTTALAISGTLVLFCYAQDFGPTPKIKTGGSGLENPGQANPDPGADYAMLSRRVIELGAQSELLSQLAEEHKKRANEAPRDQSARVQWERELSNELAAKSQALLRLLNNTRNERASFVRAHSELIAATPPNSPTASTRSTNPDGIAFMGLLEERVGAVQQEIVEVTELGRIYSAQLQTNTTPAEFSRITLLIQDNRNTMRQLQKEASDLELKRLEFRALRAQ